MARRWTILVATGIAAAGVALAPGGPEAEDEAVAATSLDSLVAELKERSESQAPASDRWGVKRGARQHMPVPERVPDPETRACSSLAEGSSDCSDLPRDGCLVPAVRIPGDIDCSKLPREPCSELLDSEGAELPRCQRGRGDPAPENAQTRPPAP